MGSQAGAGSSDFHIYRRHRRTEQKRQEQLDADRKDLDDKTAELQHTSRTKFREAEARKAQAQREWAWAHNLVRTELGGNKLSRALSLQARLVDTVACHPRSSC